MNFSNPIKERVWINFDPRTKLLMLLVANTIIISDNESMVVTLLKYGFVLLAFLILLDMGKFKMSVIYMVIYAASVGADIALSQGNINGLSFGGVALRILVYLTQRMLPGVMLAWFVLHSTKVSEFIAGMQKMHLPQAITIPFAIVFRFFPTLSEEYRYIQDAMKMRGIGFGNGIMAGLEYRMVPLLVSVTKIGDELSAAAMTRGLTTDRERSNFHEMRFGLTDYIIFVLLIVSMILFVFGLVRG